MIAPLTSRSDFPPKKPKKAPSKLKKTTIRTTTHNEHPPADPVYPLRRNCTNETKEKTKKKTETKWENLISPEQEFKTFHVKAVRRKPPFTRQMTD